MEQDLSWEESHIIIHFPCSGGVVGEVGVRRYSMIGKVEYG